MTYPEFFLRCFSSTGRVEIVDPLAFSSRTTTGPSCARLWHRRRTSPPLPPIARMPARGCYSNRKTKKFETVKSCIEHATVSCGTPKSFLSDHTPPHPRRKEERTTLEHSPGMIYKYVMRINGMLRASATRRAEGKASLPSHHGYTPVEVQPHDQKSRRLPGFLGNRLLQRILLLVAKVLLALALVAPVVFILTWNHLFAIDVVAASAESDGGAPPQKTFTVR